MADEERRQEYLKTLMDNEQRISRLETLRESDKETLVSLTTAIKESNEKLSAVLLAVNTMKTERNTVIAVASVFGATVTWLAKGVFAMMTGVAK